MVWLTDAATRRRVMRTSGGLLAILTACRPPAATHVSRLAMGPAQSAHLPEPGVYVLQRAEGLALPADLKPTGNYNFYERVLAGWLYLTAEGEYQTIICADLVDATGRVPNTLDGGPSGGRYWAAGGRIYFSDPIADGPVDSIAVRVRGDTVEFVHNEYVRDRTGVIPRSLIPLFLCARVRASGS